MSELSDKFEQAWGEFGLGKIPKREYEFHQTRKFRLDYAWPRQRVAVELEGFVDHRSAKGFHRDTEKGNLAIECGWFVIRHTSRSLGSKRKRQEACEQIIRVLKARTTADMHRQEDLKFRENHNASPGTEKE